MVRQGHHRGLDLLQKNIIDAMERVVRRSPRGKSENALRLYARGCRAAKPGVRRPRLLSPEAEAIERHTGWTFEEWQAQLGRGSMLAHHGLLFVLLKRSRPTLRGTRSSFRTPRWTSS